MKKSIFFSLIGVIGFLCLGTVYAQHLRHNTSDVLYSISKSYDDEKYNYPNDGTTKAAGDVIFESTFADASDWVIGSEAGTQGSWVIGQYAADESTSIGAGYFGAANTTTAADGFAYFNGIKYLLNASTTNPVLTQNAWVQTNAISFAGLQYVEISFDQNYRKFNHDLVLLEFSKDNGVTWSYSDTLNTDMLGNSPRRINRLSRVVHVDNASQGIFRFRWNSDIDGVTTPNNHSAGYAWVIDDVKITELWDANLVSTYNYWHTSGSQLHRYSQIPSTQVGKITTEHGVYNYGTNALTNVKATQSGAVGTVITQDVITSLPFLGLDTLVNEFNVSDPTTLGTKTISAVLEMDQTDQDPANNGIADFSFEVTEYIMAADYGTGYRDFGLRNTTAQGATEPLNEEGIGVSFDIVNDQKLYAVNFRFYMNNDPDNGNIVPAPPVGTEVYAQIYQLNPGEAISSSTLFTLLKESDIFTLESNTAADMDSVYTLVLTEPLDLEAGNNYLAMIRFNDTLMTFASRGATNSNSGIQIWRRVNNHTRIWWSGSSATPAIHLNFKPIAPPAPPCAFTTSFPTVCLDSSVTFVPSEEGGVWTTSDATIAEVTQTGVVTGKATGTAEITYTGGTLTCTGTAKRNIVVTEVGCGNTPPPVVPNPPAGVNDMDNVRSVSIFPNPSNDQVNIQFDLKNSETVTIEITDLKGSRMLVKTIEHAPAGTTSIAMDTNHLASGIYSVTIRTNQSLSTQKLIKQ